MTNMRQWAKDQIALTHKKAIPVLSFPAIQLMGITVKDLIADSDTQARGMLAIAEQCATGAAVSMMDLSVEAEAFGSAVRITDSEVPSVIASIVTSAADADALPVPSVGTGRTGLYIEAIGKAARMITDRPVLAGVIGPYSLAGRLMDTGTILLHCRRNPAMVHAVLEKATAFLLEYIKGFKTAGAQGIVIAEPAAGLLSPKMMPEFSGAYCKQIVDALQDDSFAAIYHNCGNSVPKMIPELVSIGAMGYHFGDVVNMAELIPQIPNDVLVMGNVSPVGCFYTGTPQSTRASTLEIMGACCQFPNFIISSGCDIPPMSPWANIDAFFAAVDEFYSGR